jgi:hypothetical protein
MIKLLVSFDTSGYDAAHPKSDTMSYWYDADAGKASWISFDEKPDSLSGVKHSFRSTTIRFPDVG